jgi:hypothetical protein
VNEMTNNLSNYLKGINYEKVGKYEEAFNIFQNDSSDFSLSKLVIYQYLGLGTDKNYKSSLENLKKIKSNVERKFLASYLLLNEDKKNSTDYLTLLKDLANKKNGSANEILGDLYLKGIFVEKNYKKAKKYYEDAISNGNINAIEKLSDLYLKEETDFFSDKEAVSILEKHSSKNISTIFFRIAKIYSNSNYSVYDRKLAIDNYKKANDLGFKLAKERVKKIEGC